MTLEECQNGVCTQSAVHILKKKLGEHEWTRNSQQKRSNTDEAAALIWYTSPCLRSLQAHKYSDLPAAPPCLEIEHHEGVTQRIHTGTNLLKNKTVLRMSRSITVIGAFRHLVHLPKPSACTSASHQLTSSCTKNIMHQIS